MMIYIKRQSLADDHLLPLIPCHRTPLTLNKPNCHHSISAIVTSFLLASGCVSSAAFSSLMHELLCVCMCVLVCMCVSL